MRTVFETGWRQDAWSPNMGQAGAGAGGFFGDLISTGGDVAEAYLQQQRAEEERKRQQAQAEALRIQQQTLQQQQAVVSAQQGKILGMSPTTALLVGGLGVAAILGVVALTRSK